MRAEKQYMVEDIRGRISGSDYVFFLDYTRLTVAKMSSLRGKLRIAGSDIRVVKNRLLKLVCTGLGLSGIDGIMKKPTAVVTGKDDVAAARVIQEFVRDEERPLRIKGGLIKGTVLNASEVLEFANLPSREVLRQRVVGTIAAPMSRLVGVMSRKLSSLVYVIQAIEKKKST